MFQRRKSIRTRLMNSAKYLMLPFLVINACIIITMIRYTAKKPIKYNTCYMDAISLAMQNRTPIEDGGPIPLEDVLLSDDQPTPGESIFFLETTCPCSDPKYYMLNLASREACAIESAALHNPSMNIFVLFACANSRQQVDPTTEAILSYSNVKLRRVNLWQLAKNTSIHDWISKDELFRSRFLMVNLSDLLRLLTLYRFGGIYMDMDVVVLRSFENEPPNFVGAESKVKIGNSILRLEPKGFGHKIIEYFLLDYQMNYNGDIWAVNGPVSLSRVMSYICNTNNITVMQSDQRRCQGIKVFRSSDFYAISDWAYFFEPQFANETMELLKNSYAAHLWGHISTQRDLRVNSNSAYIQLATQNCPKVLAAARKWFD
ncbi:lactosylceramide 4-alpha-galactosyltransferase-like [Drosophila albomicans]|uniref:Lactosylceramide 4-alpha-galactosyltransferase-like n=1 Tax=Drosophila albomicans TaxID=7291 RepID=A0A6P8W719_DROAB|nr:lactosylceramide 4-alpha-galactosyltransferase-like [Drosophila albomicans]